MSYYQEPDEEPDESELSKSDKVLNTSSWYRALIVGLFVAGLVCVFVTFRLRACYVGVRNGGVDSWCDPINTSLLVAGIVLMVVPVVVHMFRVALTKSNE